MERDRERDGQPEPRQPPRAGVDDSVKRVVWADRVMVEAAGGDRLHSVSHQESRLEGELRRAHPTGFTKADVESAWANHEARYPRTSPMDSFQRAYGDDVAMGYHGIMERAPERLSSPATRQQPSDRAGGPERFGWPERIAEPRSVTPPLERATPPAPVTPAERAVVQAEAKERIVRPTPEAADVRTIKEPRTDDARSLDRDRSPDYFKREVQSIREAQSKEWAVVKQDLDALRVSKALDSPQKVERHLETIAAERETVRSTNSDRAALLNVRALALAALLEERAAALPAARTPERERGATDMRPLPDHTGFDSRSAQALEDRVIKISLDNARRVVADTPSGVRHAIELARPDEPHRQDCTLDVTASMLVREPPSLPHDDDGRDDRDDRDDDRDPVVFMKAASRTSLGLAEQARPQKGAREAHLPEVSDIACRTERTETLERTMPMHEALVMERTASLPHDRVLSDAERTLPLASHERPTRTMDSALLHEQSAEMRSVHDALQADARDARPSASEEQRMTAAVLRAIEHDQENPFERTIPTLRSELSGLSAASARLHEQSNDSRAVGDAVRAGETEPRMTDTGAERLRVAVEEIQETEPTIPLRLVKETPARPFDPEATPPVQVRVLQVPPAQQRESAPSPREEVSTSDVFRTGPAPDRAIPLVDDRDSAVRDTRADAHLTAIRGHSVERLLPDDVREVRHLAVGERIALFALDHEARQDPRYSAQVMGEERAAIRRDPGLQTYKDLRAHLAAQNAQRNPDPSERVAIVMEMLKAQDNAADRAHARLQAEVARFQAMLPGEKDRRINAAAAALTSTPSLTEQGHQRNLVTAYELGLLAPCKDTTRALESIYTRLALEPERIDLVAKRDSAACRQACAEVRETASPMTRKEIEIAACAARLRAALEVNGPQRAATHDQAYAWALALENKPK